MPRTLIAAALIGAAMAVAAPVGAAVTTPDPALAPDVPPPVQPINVGPALVDSFQCVAPQDVQAIDGVLAASSSPLAGHAASFVRSASAVGMDPRALVAIAAHETLLATYGPSQEPRNPFGLGPGWRFASYDAAIATAAEVLGDGYLSEGRTTVATIGPKWAPVGAGNDPTNLNQAWPSGVASYYRALGGDPQLPVLLAAQPPVNCATVEPGVPATPAPEPERKPPSGPPVVTAWGGAPPAVAGTEAWNGGDPVTGAAAAIDGFVFPLAVQRRAQIRYADDFAAPGTPGCHGRDWQCAVDLHADPGAAVVASLAGTVRAATPEEQESGIGFWVRGAREAVGYAPLAAYSAGIIEGTPVVAGQPLGTAAGPLRVAWTRAGARVNPYAMLAATRPPDGAPETAVPTAPPPAPSAQAATTGA